MEDKYKLIYSINKHRGKEWEDIKELLNLKSKLNKRLTFTVTYNIMEASIKVIGTKRELTHYLVVVGFNKEQVDNMLKQAKEMNQ